MLLLLYKSVVRNNNDINIRDGSTHFKLRFESIKVSCKDELAVLMPFGSVEEQTFRLVYPMILF